MANINTLVIHCSDSPQGRGDNAETIHRWHLEKGWDGIGYHYVIDEDGIVENGRPEYWTGAHVSGHNTDSLGICLIGEGDYGKEQFLSLIDLLSTLLKIHDSANIYEHCYFNPDKGCPLLNEVHRRILRFFFEERYIEK